MKTKIIKKEVLQEAKPVLQFTYCCSQSLLSFQSPYGYTIGSYGWECDYYDTPKAIISTGSRPVGIRVDYNIIDKYNEAAKSILKYYKGTADEIMVTINTMLLDCIDELLGVDHND
jgi:hypothetical protein